MNKTLSVLTVLTALTLMSVASVYAVEVWRWTTIINVMEPFEIITTLPTNATLYPGNYSYIITVINHATQDFNATLYWNVTTTDITIAPPSGSSYVVRFMNSTTIPVTIDISLTGTNGTATINWWIERTAS